MLWAVSAAWLCWLTRDPLKIIIMIIKRISRAPIYHTRWQHRALYNNTNHTHTHTHTQTHTHARARARTHRERGGETGRQTDSDRQTDRR